MINLKEQNISVSNIIPHKEKKVIAAIDIGTNSIHMVIVEIEPSFPSFTIVSRHKDTVRLGDRDPKTGNLTEKAISLSLKLLKRCKDLAESLNAEEIIAVATSATRESPNGEAFLARIESELGLVVNLISGQEEARRIYLGVLSAMDFEDRPKVIIDIGGGSTEIILGDVRQTRFLSSTKIGAVRLTQQFISSDPISKVEFNYLQAYVRGMLERSGESIWNSLELNENPDLIGTSGTIETLAEIHALEKSGSVPNPLTGYQISRQDLEDILSRLAKMTVEEREKVPGMSDRRSSIIVAGGIILTEAMKMLNFKSITVCERALREGIIVDWMLTRGLINNRLKYQKEIRNRSVLRIANKYQVDFKYSELVASFALSLFDRTKGYLHNWGEYERELLWSGAILHNCGTYISHSAHHKHSYYLIRNAELLGFTELELELIANIARYHRKSKPKKKHEPYQKLPKKNYQLMVRQLSAILRIAVALDRRRLGAIASLDIQWNPDLREIKLNLVPTEIGDDCALELWSIDYKKPIFEEEYNIKLITEVKQI